jgi:membrane fusion protein, multidrug efflux system
MELKASDAPGHGRLRRRRNIVIGVVVLAVIIAVGGLLLSTSIKSPQQLAAQAAPPGLTRLTAPVMRQVLRNSVTAQGKVSKPPQLAQTAGGTVPASSGPADSDTQPIVTRILRHPGSSVGPGSVIVEVAAQPVFVLQGTVPTYRNLVPRETGSDVAQLQQGLESLGYSVGGDTLGVFGPGTSAAVAAFYQGIGYAAPVISTGPKANRGAWVPLAEIIFLPRLPAHVVSIGAKVGGAASGSLVTLSVGHPAIRGQLSVAERQQVRPGMSVKITNQVTGASIPGTVTSVGSQIETKKSLSGGAYVALGIRPGRPLPASLAGQDVTLTISGARSSGPVLAVPESAVFAAADGQTYVSKVTGPSSQARVPVRAGMTGDGLVQITPDSGGIITTGNQVVTGEDFARPADQQPGA